jgi:hypothetical protein
VRHSEPAEPQNEAGGSETILPVEDEAAVRQRHGGISTTAGIQRDRGQGWARRSRLGARAQVDSYGGQRRRQASHERRRSGERICTVASGHAVSLCFRLCGKNHSRPQGGRPGNELPSEALHTEATVNQDSQGRWTRHRLLRSRIDPSNAIGIAATRYNNWRSGPCCQAQGAPFP